MRLPGILGKSRKALKLMSTAAQKCVSASSLHAIVIDSNSTEKHKRRKTTVVIVPQMKKRLKVMSIVMKTS